MGADCSREPDTRNLCHVSVGDYTPSNMTGFCSEEGPAGDSHRETFTRKMSNAGEWIHYKTEHGCSYNDCNGYQDIGFGCCGGGCCAIVGDKLYPQRFSFTGNPVICCFNDLECASDSSSQYNPLCFSDDKQQNTCADGKNGQPNHRSIISSDCQDALTKYCTGTMDNDDPKSTDWLARWTQNGGGTGSCNYALLRNIFDSGGTGHCFDPSVLTPVPGICNIDPPLPYDAAGYFWAQNLISAVMKRYAEQGFEIGTLPGFPGYNPFQDYLYNNICCPYPGLCQEGLDVACAPYTAQRMSLNPAVSQWCGCHLNINEYQAYSVKYNIPPQCTPMCNRIGTIPIIGINGLPVNCDQNVCMIDGVTLNLINSQISGGIDMDQICAGCGNANCQCIVSDTTVDITNSTIGGNVIPVNQACGTLSCNQTNPGLTGPAVIPVPCGSTGFNPYAGFDAATEAAQADAKRKSIFWTLVIVGVALLLIFLIIFFIQPNFFPNGGFLIPRTKPSYPSFTPAPTSYNSINDRNFIPYPDDNLKFMPQSQYNSINNRNLTPYIDENQKFMRRSDYNSILNR